MPKEAILLGIIRKLVQYSPQGQFFKLHKRRGHQPDILDHLRIDPSDTHCTYKILLRLFMCKLQENTCFKLSHVFLLLSHVFMAKLEHQIPPKSAFWFLAWNMIHNLNGFVFSWISQHINNICVNACTCNLSSYISEGVKVIIRRSIKEN